MNLSPRQKDVLQFIRRFQSAQGFGPTVREICQGLGLSSPGSLIKHLRALEERGFLSHSPGKKRTWKLTGYKASLAIPLLGRIAAGSPILAEENLEAELLFDPVLFGSDQLFALKVKGDSMTGVHILDGDLAVIRPQEEAEDGQIVAVLIEGLEPEATLKVLRRKKGRIELQAANAAYKPLVFEGKDLGRVSILGRLVGVIRTGR